MIKTLLITDRLLQEEVGSLNMCVRVYVAGGVGCWALDYRGHAAPVPLRRRPQC